ncbi:fatty acid desaturase [Rubrolithibacter danxiaensis]|uniref:fatty acid desaturase n=1 Tax=Rubrolithibacter danxiaensis TaxID=3390805 RepID=UPI003BF84F85
MAAPKNTGVFIALIVISCWVISISFLLNWNFSWSDPFVYLFVLIQTHLYTGLFITAHDAMHRTVSSNIVINNATGWLCTLLYALFPFDKLNRKHHKHHRFVHTEEDPDYHNGNFISWYFRFFFGYISWWQLIAMAVVFNILKAWIPEANLILFWVIPSLLSTVQLFYFGTWLPHHGEHQNKHHSRTLKRNHFLAFISCYFFGYHYEHHASPGTPWWQLWKSKESY